MLETLVGILVLLGALAVVGRGRPHSRLGDVQLTRFGGGIGLLALAVVGGRAAGNGLVPLAGGVRHVVLVGAILGVLGGLALVLDAMEPTR